MIEVQELAARLEPFVGSPVLGPLLVTPGFSEPDWGNPAIEQSRMGTAAVLWAMSCIEQCSKPDPCGTGFILADTISALPQVCTLPRCTAEPLQTVDVLSASVACALVVEGAHTALLSLDNVCQCAHALVVAAANTVIVLVSELMLQSY